MVTRVGADATRGNDVTHTPTGARRESWLPMAIVATGQAQMSLNINALQLRRASDESCVNFGRIPEFRQSRYRCMRSRTRPEWSCAVADVFAISRRT